MERALPDSPYVLANVAAAELENGNEAAANKCIEKIETTFHGYHLSALVPSLSSEWFDTDLYQAWANPNLLKVAVLVAEGDRVEQGQTLVVLEAMKMEHPLKAGMSGLVEQVATQVGDQVKSQQVLVTIIEEEGPA